MHERLRNLFFVGLMLGVLYTWNVVLTSPKHTFTIIKDDSNSQEETVGTVGTMASPSNISQSAQLNNGPKIASSTAKPPLNPTAKTTAKLTAKLTAKPKVAASSTPPRNNSVTEGTGDSGLCPKTPPGLKGAIKPSLDIVDWSIQEKKHTELTAGGFWRPSSCRARHKVAILIPYRARKEHLHVFTNTMHDFLQKQQLEYAIYVIEQAGDGQFNRALLFNIGYKEAMKDQHWGCLVFHDVDNIPLDDRNLYHCSERPRHLSVAVQRMNFRLPYIGYFGGVSMMTTDHYEMINGMSNKYWGWGGEDDDLYYRCTGKKLTPVLRYPAHIGRYKTISQHHIQGPRNPKRGKLLKQWAARQATDGIRDLKYKVIKREYRKLFTYILADLSLMEEKKKQ